MMGRAGMPRGRDDVEFAALGYIDRFNHRRFHGEITEEISSVMPGRVRSHLLPSNRTSVEAATQ
jgi:hypothetical protein